MKKKEVLIAGVLTVWIAFMDISGLPCALFVNVKILDIEPIYWYLMLNHMVIGIVAFFVLKFLCHNWKLGLNIKGVAAGFSSVEILNSWGATFTLKAIK